MRKMMGNRKREVEKMVAGGGEPDGTVKQVEGRFDELDWRMNGLVGWEGWPAVTRPR